MTRRLVEDEADAMTVGELAQKVGKSARAVRLYEEMGLIVPKGRSNGNYRQFGPDALVRLRWICHLVDVGLPLTEVRDLLEVVAGAETAGVAMVGVRDRYAAVLARVEQQIDRLTSLRRELSHSLEYLERCQGCGEACVPECCRRCRLHGDAPEPDLVAGLRAQVAKIGDSGGDVSCPGGAVEKG